MSELSDVFTANEAADYLKISKATLLRLAHRQMIAGVRIGRQWRFSRKTISNLVNQPGLFQRRSKAES